MRSSFFHFPIAISHAFSPNLLPSPFQKQIEGDLEKGIQFVGQVQGLIHDVPTVQALVTRVLAEAETIHSKQHQDLFRKSA